MESTQDRDREALEALLRDILGSGREVQHGFSVARIQALASSLSLRRLREAHGALWRCQRSHSIDARLMPLLRTLAVTLDRPRRDRKTASALLGYLHCLLARVMEGREAATAEVVGLDDPGVLSLAKDILDSYEYRRAFVRGSRREDLRPLGAGTPRDAADALVESIGYGPLAAMWKSVSRDQAQTTLAHVLAQNLVYEVEMLQVAKSEDLARRFISLLGPSARFLTNGDLIVHAHPRNGSWMPLTGATGDSGIVGVDAERVLMLWAEDED